ncbi:ABC transporter permease subunit [Microvirga alba]|uniref:ABC transporter permease subunit n=2 Tax=Microvirga alba TaxID=2791025 RepID=A0A931FNQ8_9HYPH|nr:ABC transporter permease subunit [Microvirga alba]MBF9232597.1 ABC transporter permease subunit [Microvirga alba]
MTANAHLEQPARAAPGTPRNGSPQQFGRQAVTAVPMLWLLVFFALPFVFVMKISLAEADIAVPPYTALLTWVDNKILSIHIDLSKYLFLFEDSLYLAAYLGSLKIAAVSTIFCLFIAFPIALFIARQKPETRIFWLALVMLPFWTSMLLRVYAWIGILQSNGIINSVLLELGLIHEPLALLQTDFAVYLGIIYSYLPFMVLPLYATLEKLDETLIEASADLGARPTTSFLTVTLPLALPGVVAGCVMVFVPAVGEFVIPALMGGPDTLMIGRVLWDEFFSNRDWPMASAVAIVMLIVLVVPVMLLRSRGRHSLGHG